MPDGMTARARARARTVDALRAGGVVAAEDEADDLMRAAASAGDLASMVARRLAGEPTAWITGRADFLGVDVVVDPGVYVPRWKTEALACHAIDHLPAGGTALDLCTGSGAVAAFLAHGRPEARVVGTDVDEAAVRCARRNGIEAYRGDLFGPVPAVLRAAVDVIVSVPPYVPDGMLRLLPPDVTAHEPLSALGGGPDGLSVARRIVAASRHWLRSGGWLVIEAGLDQIGQLERVFLEHGFLLDGVIEDGDGDPAGVCGSTGVGTF